MRLRSFQFHHFNFASHPRLRLPFLPLIYSPRPSAQSPSLHPLTMLCIRCRALPSALRTFSTSTLPRYAISSSLPSDHDNPDPSPFQVPELTSHRLQLLVSNLFAFPLPRKHTPINPHPIPDPRLSPRPASLQQRHHSAHLRASVSLVLRERLSRR